MTALSRMCETLVLRWRVENYHRQQMRKALQDRSRSEHLERRQSGIKDTVAGGI